MVFNRIRRTSEQLLLRNRSSTSQRSSSISYTSPPPSNPNNNDRQTTAHLTLFDLPPEIRNAIYELAASETSLTIPHLQPKKPSASPMPLLLASQQVRSEFRSILLCKAQITFKMQDFDCRNLIRVVSSLYPTELKALRSNPNLNIAFLLPLSSRPSNALMASLRRWLENRSQNLDRIPFGYSIKWIAEPSKTVWKGRQEITPSTSKRLDVVEVYLEAFALMHWTLEENLQEGLQWELETITHVFLAEKANLEAILKQEGRRASVTSSRSGIGYMMSL